MSVELQITVTRDTASPSLRRLMEAVEPHRIATRIAPPLARHWRDHLAGLPRNKRGYPSTGFWEDAARRVTGVALDSACVLSCDKLGIRQRLRGGPITAVKGEYLTIPVCAEAYGATVADWGRDTLTLVVLSDGRRFLALWTGSEESRAALRSAGVGKLGKRASASARSAQKLRGYPAERPRVIVFRPRSGSSASGEAQRAEKHLDLKFLFKLQRGVEQDPNPNVIPPDLAEVARREVARAVEDHQK